MGDNIYEFFFSKNYPLGGIGGIISTSNNCELESTTKRIGAAFIHDKSIASRYVETHREPKGNTIEVKALNKTAITCTAVETLSGYTRERCRPTHVGDFWLHRKPKKVR